LHVESTRQDARSACASVDLARAPALGQPENRRYLAVLAAVWTGRHLLGDGDHFRETSGRRLTGSGGLQARRPTPALLPYTETG